MATGDLKNNLRILNSELRKLNVSSNIYNLAEISAGNTDAFLDVFDNVLQWHNPALSRLINIKGLKPPSKEENKAKFLESVYLIFREIFSWKPPLTVSQFLSSGFHEKKVIMCTEIIRLVIQKIHELEPKAAKKQNLVDTGHSGLKLILKQPKKFVPPLREKDMNVKSVFETSSAKCGLLKDESCIWQCKRSETSSGANVSALAGNNTVPACRESRNAEEDESCIWQCKRSEASSCANVSALAGNNTVPACRESRNAEEVIDDRILTELLEFKNVVLSKFESLESRLSATEKRINILEITLNSLREENNTTNILPIPE